MSDQIVDLVLQAQKGMSHGASREAFGELVARYEKMVLNVVFPYLWDEGEAEDLTQEVFLHAMKKISQLREPKTFGSWMSTMARRKAINYLRQKRLVQYLDFQEMKEPSFVEDNWSLSYKEEIHVLLHKAKEGLNKDDREIIDAFYMKGLGIRQIAGAFRIPEGTVKRRLHVARKRLKRILVESHGELLVV